MAAFASVVQAVAAASAASLVVGAGEHCGLSVGVGGGDENEDVMLEWRRVAAFMYGTAW